MNALGPFEPPSDFVDPRLAAGFEPELWPLCNGGAAPAFAAADRHQRRCIEFLAACYAINLAQSRLGAARASFAGRTVLASLERMLRNVEAAFVALEDRYAPVGFYGETASEGLWIRNVDFVPPELPRVGTETASMSSQVRIPGIEEIPASEFTGEVRLRRWGHGKVDL